MAVGFVDSTTQRKIDFCVQAATDLKVAQTFPGFQHEIKCDKSIEVKEPETFESSVTFDVLEKVDEKLNTVFDKFETSN